MNIPAYESHKWNECWRSVNAMVSGIYLFNEKKKKYEYQANCVINMPAWYANLYTATYWASWRFIILKMRWKVKNSPTAFENKGKASWILYWIS